MAETNINNRSLKERWNSWWNGTPVAPAAPPEPVAAPTAPEPEKPKARLLKGDKPVWEGDAFALQSHVWGEGHASATEDDFVSRMYPQLGLNNTMTVLDVGDGLAGGAMAISKNFQSFVDCYLTTADAAPTATRMLQKNKVATKVKLHPYDNQPIKLTKRYHAVSLRRALWRIEDPAAFMDTVSGQLREHARLVMAEYLAETPVASLESVSKWFHDEQFRSSMSLSYLLNILEKNGFDVRVADDVTAQHRADIRTGLQKIKDLAVSHMVADGSKDAIVNEAGRWAQRARLLDDGLQLYRFFAQRRK